MIFIIGSVTSGYAQVKIGDNPTVINPNSLLELESNMKGLLLPRLNLLSTNNPAPMTVFVEGMFVYNLAVNGAADTAVSPGLYYCDGVKWIRLGGGQNNATQVLKTEYTATAGQLQFQTPAGITDMNKITVYRNGIIINSIQVNVNTIATEVSCIQNDNIKIVQIL
ncbi:hypothetical protein F0919_08845 [Taibaiella lutea]|uniref:Uncharacterized protein n=1 Tax=Taibaiella lutea TaxID=2608001 RepID=A0A5M6CHN7_9BACT|nr:hypothetical protein [Taibaiella lutea]KAA5534711.1 hypothetical protein F0919_08845 [Taibaiella lutea]